MTPVKPKPPHSHSWEMRGKKVFSAGVWVTTYECRCGEHLPRCCGGKKA